MSREACLVALALATVGSASAASIEAHVVDGAGKPLADAAVWAVSPANPVDARGARAQIEQADREFLPYVTVIQQGTTVTFPNRDPILHHVYSFSPAKAFEIKLYTGRSPLEIVFDKAGLVTLGCNIHDWMIAYVQVVPTPYFGRTDASGVVRLRDLPAGPYEVRAWHPQQAAAVAARDATLDATMTVRLPFAIDVKARKPKFKPPLDRQRY
jgi:plastocyanin